MRNLKQLLALSAIVFVALSCVKEVKDNPTYDKETNEVTAQFILSVSTDHGEPATKMTKEDVQYYGNFRGMTDVQLFTYALDFPENPANGHFLYQNGASWDETASATRRYDLGAAMSEGEISATNTSKVLQISLPLGTNSVLVYGRAPKTTLGSDDQGNMTISGTLTGVSPENISFSLQNRMSENGKKAFAQFADMMGHVLTGLLTAGRTVETAGALSTRNRDLRYGFWWPMDEYSETLPTKGDNNQPLPNNTTHVAGAITYTWYYGSKTWRDYGLIYKYFVEHPGAQTGELSGYVFGRPLPMEEILGETYYKVTTLNSTTAGEPELRAASSKAILQLVKDVFGQIAKVSNGSINSPEEYIAKLVADEIAVRARKFFDGNPDNLAWENYATFKSNFESEVPLTNENNMIPGDVDHNTYDSRYPLLNENFFYVQGVRDGFPMNLGMPEGTATMKFVEITTQSRLFDTVIFPTSTPDYMMGGSPTSTLSIYNYHYPAELIYWTNSPIRTNDTEVAAADYPHTWASWDAPNWSGGWESNSTVRSSTRSVAVTKEMNYGTALLMSTFKYGAATIYDNNKGIHPNEEPNEINTTVGAPFKVTGLIIGGVDDTVGWDFLSKDEQFTQVIYDKFNKTKHIAIPNYGSARRDTAFTLVWDNYKTSLGNQQAKVYVAVELVNQSGKDFWGELNLIRNGATFYLVGLLDPSDATALAALTEAYTNTTTHEFDLSRDNFNYPPFDQDGKTISIPRIFMQDFVTEADFIFGKYSLEHAYVTMPDLRASNVSLGLSVDLKWSKGFAFENVVLGDPTANTDRN